MNEKNNSKESEPLDSLAKGAAEEARRLVPDEPRLSWPLRIALTFLAAIMITNTALGIYNTAKTANNVACTRSVVNVLATLRVQAAHSPTQKWIDGTLNIKSLDDLKALTKVYDKNTTAQTQAIQDALDKTCFSRVPNLH